VRKPLLLALLFVCFPVAGHAQIAEAYATLAIDHLSSVTTPYATNESTSYTPVGATIGGTINFLPFRLVTVGIDARATLNNGANMWLAGLRIQAKPPHLRLKPYFQISVGEAFLHVPQTYNSTLPNPLPVDYYFYNAALGLDYRLNHHLDFRVIEIGDGRTLGGGASNPTSFLTINSGIVVHF